MKLSKSCCCASGLPYDACCGPCHQGTAASTPEQLMRSRYSAFCLKDVAYLLETRHPSVQALNERDHLARSMEQTTWTGLQILDAPKVKENETRGTVRFTAFYESMGRPGQLHERSRFVKENGRWFYVDGEMMPPIVINRNDPCFCGSGRKFKKCHGRQGLPV